MRLSQKLDNVKMSARARNGLNNWEWDRPENRDLDFRTVQFCIVTRKDLRDALETGRLDLKRYRNFGKKSIDELRAIAGLDPLYVKRQHSIRCPHCHQTFLYTKHCKA
jgi:hypothetical protein